MARELIQARGPFYYLAEMPHGIDDVDRFAAYFK
jgi:hypothetical protein